ncbi:MAG: glycosyltransferase family 2 protein [Candidatus Moraniibacteriota bacterium]
MPKLRPRLQRPLQQKNSNSADTDAIWIVIPAYNEETVIASVIKEIRQAGYENILVVDDGSVDHTFDVARSTGIVTLRHRLNRGKGAATKTGIEAAKLLNAHIIVTMDGDGQHDPGDISRLVSPILEEQSRVVLGSRLLHPAGMPQYKILHNYIGNLITWWLFGLYVTDSQSGFRAYSRHAAELINTRYDRYEYESEVIREIHVYGLRFIEIPIAVRYTDYSMGKITKQNLANGVKTVYKMFLKLLT